MYDLTMWAFADDEAVEMLVIHRFAHTRRHPARPGCARADVAPSPQVGRWVLLAASTLLLTLTAGQARAQVRAPERDGKADLKWSGGRAVSQ